MGRALSMSSTARAVGWSSVVTRLGELEATVMDLLWDRQGPTTVRDVLELLAPRRPLAYTTVMTVVHQLQRKGFLVRVDHGDRAHVYEPTRSREAYVAELMGEALAKSTDTSAALMSFVGQMSPAEADALRVALRRRQGRAR
jgi:predicted transcriptional regulator